MNVAERLRDYLAENGVKQTVIAQKAGIPLHAFNAALNGRRHLRADELCAICDALSVSPEIFTEHKKEEVPA